MTDQSIPLRRAAEHEVVETPWGRLVWQVSASHGNSTVMTVGRCYIKAGAENGRHYHPNCEETLTVLRGRIIHSYGDQSVEMSEGDVITIPPGIVHHARNIGTETCDLAICFSSAYREAVAVPDGT